MLQPILMRTVEPELGFFHHTVVDVVSSILFTSVDSPGSEFRIFFTPDKNVEAPDRFDITVEDASEHLPAPQMLWKWSFNAKTMKYTEFLHQIVADMTEAWDI